MYYFNNLALVFALFVSTNTHTQRNLDPAIYTHEKPLFEQCASLQDSALNGIRHGKPHLYILLNPEDHAIKVKNFKRIYKTNSISIQLDSNRQQILDNSAVWGYQYGNGAIYRNYNNDFIKVEEDGSLVVYSRKTSGFRGRQLTVYYFSKTLGSPVLKLDLNNILVQFKDNPCFIENLGRRLSQTYDCSAWDNKGSSFIIVEIMKHCNENSSSE